MSTTIEETMGNHRSLVPRIVLLACGSFSPPTPMHFRMFEIARDYFEMNGTHQVLGGIVSPTHDGYGKKELAPAKYRCAMVKLALQSSKWIRFSDWETTQSQWSTTKSVLQYHQNYMNNYINSPAVDEQNGILPGWLPSCLRDRRERVQLKLLCGADLLESFAVPGLWADQDIEDIIANHGLVVISRSGATPEKFIFESDILTKYQRNITLVTNWIPNEVSSTMIRRLLSRGQSVKYLLDDLVLDYIRTNGLFNYKSKYITELKYSTQNVYNLAFIEQNHMNASSSNGHTPSDEDDDEHAQCALVTEERMDETDYSIKSILTSMNLDNRQAKVFCCGESERAAKKLLPQRAVHPGQAVQVITTERGIVNVSSTARRKERLPPVEGEQLNTKKMKISAIQQL